MEIKQVGDNWLGKKSKKAKTWEDITEVITFDGDFCSVMGKAGRTTFHSYLGRSGKRWLEMYGVTSLLNYWGEKDRLVEWAVGQVVTALEAGETLDTARSAHKRSLTSAGDHGTDTHALVEDWIKNGTVVEHEQLAEFIKWAEGKKLLASEMPLRSQKLWVAGTCDFIVEIDGKRYMGDLKTSNWVSYKQFIQCGAYSLMYEEMGYGKIDGIVIVHMPRTGGFNTHVELDVDNYKKDFESIVRLVKRDKDKSYQLYS